MSLQYRDSPDGGVDQFANVSNIIDAKKKHDQVDNTPGGSTSLFTDYGTEKMTPKWGFGDTINLIFIIIPLSIPFMFFYILYDILIFPFALVGYLYTLCLKKPVRRLEGCGFQLICLILLPLATPAIIVLWLWVLIVWFYSFFMSMPFGIIRIVFFCDGPAIANNFRLIWKYSKMMPFYRWSDVCRAMLGCIYRQGICEYMGLHMLFRGGAGALLTSVFLKYAMIVNPWLYTLEEKYCNQWSPPLLGDGDKIGDAMLEFISVALPAKRDKRTIDNAHFAPHYPFPPSSRRDVIGSQFQEHLKYPTFTKTTYKLDLKEIPEERSKDMDRNLLYVELSYTNPFHFLTGEVYFGRRKDLRWEHPMYCLQPKVGYFATFYYSHVNELFRIWVPLDATLWAETHVEGQQVVAPLV